MRLVWAGGLDTSLEATPPLDTVLGCASRLPFAEALSVADSALRTGRVTRRELRDAADGARGRGAARMRRVAQHASGLAANPLESCLRALTVELGLGFVPQLPIEVSFGERHPDLADPTRRVLLEADSFEFHGHRRALAADCVRDNDYVVAGWRVLRFAWDHVMLEPAYVVSVLEAIYGPLAPEKVAIRRRRAA